ncbi:alpha/beta fold hydrolase [Arthrobacter sp. 2RAF6]|uniref:alpha/beta fold hydrolase n=1 Tax=Arthrobacter sp. 2RAF6 TaxID=3233002 RepID=UPI003F90BA45
MTPERKARNHNSRRAGARPKMTVRTVSLVSLMSHAYSLAGTPSRSVKPVFVLLHGIGMSRCYHRRLQTVLAGQGDTHSIDLPGFGGTPKPDRQISVAEYVEIIAGTPSDRRRSRRRGRHSMGKQFATEPAVRRPELVSHVVLIGPVVDSERRTLFRQSLALGLDSLLESPSGNAIMFTDYARSGGTLP